MSHVLVAGAGVAGLSVALRLLDRGHTVELVEKGEVGKESSWAGGGILCPLLPWDYGDSLTALALRSMRVYSDWVADLESRSGRQVEYWRCGMLVQGVAEREHALDWCATRALRAEPSADVSDGLRLPDVAQVRNPRLVEALRVAVERSGGRIHAHCTLESIRRQGRRMVAFHTSAGALEADLFVLATGAWAGVPLAELAEAPTIRPVRGQMLLYRLDPGVLDTILFRDGLYVIPRQDGHILVGSTLENAGFDKSTDEATLQRLHTGASEMLPALASLRPIRHWAGLRPGAPDNIPLIDAHPEFENVHVNTGQYRYGVTLAPASAELLVDLIEARRPVLDPLPYSWGEALARAWTPAL